MSDTQDVQEVKKRPLYDALPWSGDGLGRRRKLSREDVDPDQEVEVRTVNQQK